MTLDWVDIGNPGNLSDPTIMWTDSTSGYGGVGYEYSIGKYEITNAQYVEFLNAVAATDPYGLFNLAMEGSTRGGINRRLEVGGYVYSVKAPASGENYDGSDYTYDNKPVNFVTWYDAIRFANWLTSGDTENGGYTISFGGPDAGAVTIPDAIQRAAWATGSTPYYLLPSEDEWYKAAYYEEQGVFVGYHDHATGTSVTPNNLVPPLDSGNSAAYSTGDWGVSDYPMVDVDSYAFSASPNGTLNQAGNAMEWTDGVIGANRAVRGGTWGLNSFYIGSDTRMSIPASNPLGEGESALGFRLARVGIIPEPTTAILLTLGVVTLLGRRLSRQYA